MATETVDTPGSLNAAIDALAAAAPGVTTIELGANIALASDLEAIDLPAGVSLVLDGQNHTLDGGGVHRGLMVFVGGVTIENVTLANLRARGGTGGSGVQGAGGGGGLGGALFVATAGTVTLSAITFSGDSAVGGASCAAAGGPLGGGGGMGGAGGTGADPGGGGIGQTAVGSSGSGAGGGIVPDGGPGGDTAAGVGGANAGGGAAGNAAGGAGGGIGASKNVAQFGGAGGFGGGGGAGSAMYGGGGGFGGGGGGGNAGAGAAGGYGGFGGGGGGGATGGAAGFAAGAGSGKAGGGGLGAGGDIFVETGGKLVLGSGTLAAGTVTGGTGSGGGKAFGSGVFLMAGETLTLAPAGTLSIGGVITDQSGSDPTNIYNQPGTGALRLTTGTVALAAANNFIGGITIAATAGSPALLELATPGAAGKGAITFDTSANGQETLRLDGTVMPANTISGVTPITFFDFAGVPFVAGAHAALAGGTVSLVSGGVTVALHPTAADPTIPFAVESDGAGGSMVEQAPTLTAANETEFDAAMVRADLTDGVPFATTVISLDPASGTLALTSDPYAVNLAANARLEIRGNGATMDGGGQFRGLFAYAGSLTVSNLTLANNAAFGGTSVSSKDPGGGGMGAGGGLFVAAHATVSLSGVTFSNASAVGGAGGNYFGGGIVNATYGSGGGGMGGESVNYGGGGIGRGATGGIVLVGSYQWAGNPGIILGGAPGGAAGSGIAGGASGGGGASGTAGGGGGVGGVAPTGRSGGQGGFGGGGGGGYLHGGAGGFGGGGGGARDNPGAAGGFGGGGGAGVGGLSGVGGFGAGVGSDFAGGGGLGAGGDVFVQQGGVLSIGGSGSLTGGTVQRGYGGLGKTAGAGGVSGQAFASGIFIQGNDTVTLDPGPGQAISIGDVTGDQSGSTLSNQQPGTGAIVVTGGGFVGLDAPADFTGGLTIEGGSTASLAFDAAGTGAIHFAGAGTVELQVAPVANGFAGFGPGDAIDALGLAGSTGTYDPAANTLTLNTPGGTVPIVFATGTYTATDFAIHDSGSDLLISFACFTTGARILTDAGEVEVQHLIPGMRVVSLTHRRAMTVRWVGSRTIDCARRPDAWAVRIAKGAFGEGRPHRDLLLSGDHAVCIDGALVPVRHLANGASIAAVQSATATYWHVELSAHAVLLADGLPVESYLDTGNRASFAAEIAAA